MGHAFNSSGRESGSGWPPSLRRQTGETARSCSVEGHEPVAGFLRQGGTEMLQLRHGYGVQVRMALQQVQDIAFIFLRSVGACSVQQEAAGSQTPEGGQQNAPLPLGVASGDGGIETAGVGNAFSQQGLPAARASARMRSKHPGASSAHWSGRRRWVYRLVKPQRSRLWRRMPRRFGCTSLETCSCGDTRVCARMLFPPGAAHMSRNVPDETEDAPEGPFPRRTRDPADSNSRIRNPAGSRVWFLSLPAGAPEWRNVPIPAACFLPAGAAGSLPEPSV